MKNVHKSTFLSKISVWKMIIFFKTSSVHHVLLKRIESKFKVFTEMILRPFRKQLRTSCVSAFLK